MNPHEGVPWMTEAEPCAVPGLRAVAVETANGKLLVQEILPAAAGYTVWGS